MLRLLKRLIQAVIVLAVLVGAVAFVLPRQVTVQRSTVINATPEAIYPYLSDLRRFNEWSPWANLDPNTKYTFEGEEQGPGQRMRWASNDPKVGTGTQEIMELTTNEQVKVSLDFGDLGPARSWYNLTPEGNGTQVTWGFASDLGFNPLTRWMGLMFDTRIGAEFERGLASLKQVVEKQASGS
jgi:uncharacterized protein YndB with AHSA1/START domain